MRALLEGEGVLHPILIISLGVIFARVGTARFLSVGGSNSSLRTTVVSTK